MPWLHRKRAPLKIEPHIVALSGLAEVKTTKPADQIECKSCQENIPLNDWEDSLHVCNFCDHHGAIKPEARFKSLFDGERYATFDHGLRSLDPLAFEDVKTYASKLKKLDGADEAFQYAKGKIGGTLCYVGAFDFSFMGGSMGIVVGEKICRLFQKAKDDKVPAIIFSSSGGARMQEGIFSLMQLAKTCTALSQLKEAGLPFVSVLTHPTTGGVAASFAMLGDVNVAEPRALIGFAGPRVIKQTIGEDLPKGFQRAEFLLKNGMVDRVVHRSRMKEELTDLLKLLFVRPAR